MPPADLTPRATPARSAHFTPQRRDADLAPHAHRIALFGAPAALDWPTLCAYCGSPAGERIAVQKVFRWARPHDVDARPGNPYRVATARVPFCAACAARHRSSAPPISPLRRALSFVRTIYVAPAVGGAAMAAMVLGRMPLAWPLRPDALLGSALLASSALISAAGVAAAVRITRPFRVPPQSEVTRACDFSDDLSGPFERQWRVWAIRDPAFAAAFVAANRDRVYDDAHRRSRRRTEAVAVAVALVVAAAALLWRALAGG